MAQQLSVNVALVEDQGSFQALTWLTTIYNPSFRGSDALFQPLRAPDMYMTTYIHLYT